MCYYSKVQEKNMKKEEEKKDTTSYDADLGSTEAGTKKVETVQLDSATDAKPAGVQTKEALGITDIKFSSKSSSAYGTPGTTLKSVLQNVLKSLRADANQKVKTSFFEITPMNGNQEKPNLDGFLHFKFAYKPSESLNPGMRFKFELYSYHGGEAQRYAELSGAPTSVSRPCFYYDGNEIHVYSNAFCVFGLGYTQVKATSSSSGTASSSTTSYYGSSSSGGGGGGGGGKTTYTVGKGAAKAEFSKVGKTGACYEMCSASLKATKATIPATVKIGKKTYKVTKIADSAFIGYDKLTTVTINTKNLTKKGVKGSLKNSKITTIKAPKDKVKAYKKIFTKANAGKKVSVKKK